jgi:hypothetical protein
MSRLIYDLERRQLEPLENGIPELHQTPAHLMDRSLIFVIQLLLSLDGRGISNDIAFHLLSLSLELLDITLVSFEEFLT